MISFHPFHMMKFTCRLEDSFLPLLISITEERIDHIILAIVSQNLTDLKKLSPAGGESSQMDDDIDGGCDQSLYSLQWHIHAHQGHSLKPS